MLNLFFAVPYSERLVLHFGSVDHHSSLFPFEGKLHRVFLSFERLVNFNLLPAIQANVESIENEFQIALRVGFLDNRRVVLALKQNAAHRFELEKNIFGEEEIQFKNGGADFLPWTQTDFQSETSQDFFLTMRKLYRGQLRSMCLITSSNASRNRSSNRA